MIPFKSCRTGEPPGINRGFTVVELMIVLVIVGIMAGIAAPPVGRLLEGLNFRQQLNRYSAIMRYARLKAVASGEMVSLKIPEEGECVFVLSGPIDEQRDCDLGDEDILTMDPGEIYFFPEGVATPALLTLERGERTRKIRLDLLTARPVIEP